MSARATLLLISLIAVTGLAPEKAGALEGSTDPEIVVYAACGRDEAAAPSHRCHKGEKLGAFFRHNGRDTVYTVCVRFPDGRRACANEQQAARGVLYVNNITDGIEGTAQIFWYVDSVEIGHWTLDLLPAPVVPRFGVKALVVSRTHRLAGLIVRHVPPGLRVRAWRSCSAICPLRLRLTRRRGSTRRYLIAGRDRNYRFRLGTILQVQVDAPGRFDHGERIWGRLFAGKLVRRGHGHSRDTAFRRVGPLLCVPPNHAFEAATSCDRIP